MTITTRSHSFHSLQTIGRSNSYQRHFEPSVENLFSEPQDSFSRILVLGQKPTNLTPPLKLVQKFAIPYQVNLLSRIDNQKAVPALEASKQLAEAPVIALGDLHGSFLKLTETLVLAQLIRIPRNLVKGFKESASQIERLVAIDPKLESPDTKKSIKIYEAHLLACIDQFIWTGDKRQLILIGDVLGDRGPTDKLTLAIINKLRADNPERIISIASNHDNEALNMMEYSIKSKKTRFSEMWADPSRASTLRAFNLSADSAEERKALLDSYMEYFQHQKLLHYNPKTQTLYAHAPISEHNLESILKACAPQSPILARQITDWNAPLIPQIEQPDRSGKTLHIQTIVNELNQAYNTFLLYKICTPEHLEQHRFDQTKSNDFNEAKARTYHLYEQRTLPRMLRRLADPEAFKDPIIRLLTLSSKEKEKIEESLWDFIWERDDNGAKLMSSDDVPFRSRGIQTLVHGHADSQGQYNQNSTRNDYAVINLDNQARKALDGDETSNASLIFADMFRPRRKSF